MAAETMREGFWRATFDEQSALPWPVADENWLGRQHFLNALINVESIASLAKGRGHTRCPLCARRDRPGEYSYANWTWPQDLQHYVALHAVKPSREFLTFVIITGS